MTSAALVAVVLLQLSAGAPQLPQGRVEGTVLRAGSNEPLTGVRVVLARPSDLPSGGSTTTTGAGSSINLYAPPAVPRPTAAGAPAPPAQSLPPPPIPPATTGEGGKFTFSALEAGTYRLSIMKDGFVRQEYGQRVFPGQGTPLNLSAGEAIKDLVIRMTPAGNVGGRIVDGLGQPAAGVPLQLLKPVYNQLGQRTFQPVGNARTNDRGEYRMFWVTPGRFYLVGGTPQRGPEGQAGPNESPESYTFTYYPGVTDISRANVIEVSAGSEVVLDFAVPRQKLYTIRGRVVDPGSTITPPSASIALSFQALNGQNTMFSRNNFYNPSTGAFEFRDVMPGLYILYVNTQSGNAGVPVEVVNADIEGLVLNVNSGLSITGRISVEGGTLPVTGVRVQFRPVVGGAPLMFGALPSTQSVAADGTFRVDGVPPGLYKIVPPALADFYVKQMRFERSDALNQNVEIVHRGPDPPAVDIVLSTNVGQIEGMVSDSRLQPFPGAQVVLIPERNPDRADLYKTTVSDQTGRFTIKGVAPGEYKLYAWETLENNAYFDPDLQRKSASAGKSIEVSESAKLSVSVQVIN
jgi:hypothetical protein